MNCGSSTAVLINPEAKLIMSNPKAEKILSIVNSVTLSGETIVYPPHPSDPSPEELAVEWLVEEEFLNLDNTFRVTQRYALATLYFSTSGDSWTKNFKWLKPVSEGEWHGITCVAGRSAVERIILDGNNLSGFIPADVELLEFLTVLSVKNNPDLDG